MENHGDKTPEKKLSPERYLRDIFNSINEGIFIHDRATGAILDINERGREMYGIPDGPVNELTIEALSSGQPPYSHSEAAEWVRKAYEEGPQVFEWRAQHLDGSLFPVEVALTAKSIAGT
ncbi:MAG TPA: PAS domain-containing protein, partial [Pontiella sp.]